MGQFRRRKEGDRSPYDRDSGHQRLIEIRCGFAELAQREADAADARAAESKRRLEAQLNVVAEVALAAEATASRGTKENAHRAFKAAVAAARERSGVEAAAERWLRDINHINARTRVAQTRLRRERETANSLLAERDRLMTTAEAARSMAQGAREACLAARLGILAPEFEAADATDVEPEGVPGLAAARPAGGAVSVADASTVPPAQQQPMAAEMAAVGATPEVAAPASAAPLGRGLGDGLGRESGHGFGRAGLRRA